MKTNTLSYTALSMALLCAAGTSAAQTTEPEVKAFVRFDAFMAATKTARSTDMASSKAKDDSAFEEMRQHILTMYKGVAVSHSYVQASNHFDCVPTGQQPSVRILGLKSIAGAPPQSALHKPTAGDKPGSATQPATQGAGKTDAFGNAIGCEANTIPMRRITLDEMTQFPTVHDFFQKGVNGSGRPATAQKQADPDLAANHKFSIMYQNVNNLGGNANINIWSPSVTPGWGQVFTLSQEWYVGGSGANTQTVEVGWQNYPAKYGTEDSRLFIYWTADNYATTGCYNLDCAGFVQIDNSATLGGGFDDYSSFYGPQYEISAEYYLYQGNWWLAIQGTWIGYYPGWLYRGGQLAYYAQLIEYGTESDASVVWPGEGSGYWATAGFSLAAYQRNVFYLDGYGNGIYPSLTPYNTSPACYNTAGPFFDSTSSWGIYLFAGGVGGGGC
jgi:hypothetical protein